MESKKYSILSFCFGNYDLCREPIEKSNDCEYIFVTDNKNLQSDIWKIVYTEKFKNFSPVYASFYVRYHPWEFVNTDVVMIIDASIQLKENTDNLIKSFTENNYDACFTMCSYFSGTIADGINYWKNNSYKFDKTSINKFNLFANHYGMLNYKGIIEATFRIVKKSPIIEELNWVTWETCKFLKGNDDIFRVDQYVFTIIFYKEYMDKIKSLITCRNIMQSNYMQYCYHNTNKPIIMSSPKNFYYNNKLVEDLL